MDNRLQFSTGWTPPDRKYCRRCGQPHTDPLYFNCEKCRLGDWLASRLSEMTDQERREDELVTASAKAIVKEREELLADYVRDIYQDPGIVETEDDRREEKDRQDAISYCRNGF